MSTAELANEIGTEAEAAEAPDELAHEVLELDTAGVGESEIQNEDEPAPKKPTLASQKAALLEETFIQRGRVRDAEEQVSVDAEVLKGSKETLKRRQASLGELLDRLESVCHGQLELNLLPAEANEGAAKEPAAPPDDVHGLAPISVLKLPKGITEKLEGEDIERVCDLEKRMAAGDIIPGAIKGIGQTAVDKISDALVAYRAECPVPSVGESESDLDSEDTPRRERGAG